MMNRTRLAILLLLLLIGAFSACFLLNVVLVNQFRDTSGSFPGAVQSTPLTSPTSADLSVTPAISTERRQTALAAAATAQHNATAAAQAVPSSTPAPTPTRTRNPEAVSRVQQTATALAQILSTQDRPSTDAPVGGGASPTPSDLGIVTIAPPPPVQPNDGAGDEPPTDAPTLPISATPPRNPAPTLPPIWTRTVQEATEEVSAGESEPTVTVIAIGTTTGATVVSTTLPDTGGGDATPSPTPAPTQIAAVPPGTVPAYERRLPLFSGISGQPIGFGTFRVFAPENAQRGDTFTVELRLEIDQPLEPTAAAASPTAPNERPTPTRVSSSGSNGPTPTPRALEGGVEIYQRIGATLLCPEGRFEGCDGERSEDDLNPVVGERVAPWRWDVTPLESASGSYTLRAEVWIALRNLDGVIEYVDLPSDIPLDLSFRVNVGGTAGTRMGTVAAVGGVAALVILGAAFVALRRSPLRAPLRRSPARTPAANAATPHVFISYRRGSTWGHARSVSNSLKGRGADVFLDIDDINEGRFAETIEKAIDTCDFFVPILAPGTLDSYWVRREIIHAIARKKTIIPLVVDGFVLNENTLPPELTDLATHNAITMLPEFYEEAIDRLAKRFMRL
ncbi:MAG: TIR domain-containing protein [bacterium]|nr:TIR domain-containing protein [bacterium]